MIKKQVAGSAKVTESKELTDLVTGNKREVDVCIETEVAGHAVLISLECRDSARKQTVEWVDQMHGKHSSLPTNQLVLVSRSGFTRNAIKKARFCNIETIVPDELTEELAAEIGARVGLVRLGRAELTQVTKVRITVDAIPEPITFPPEAGYLPVFTQAGRYVALMRDIVLGLLNGNVAGKQVFLNPPDTIQEGDLQSDNPRIVIGNKPEALYLRLPKPESPLSRLERISITGEARGISAEVPMRHGQLQSTVYSWGEAKLEGIQAIVVVTTAEDGSAAVSLDSR
jgi:hypothetical protein